MARTITKKRLMLMVLLPLLLLSVSSNAQVFINENFSTGSGSTPPAGWTNNTITGQSYDTWRFNNPGSRSTSTPISGQFAIFDSDDYSSSGSSENVALESPSFNTTGYSVVTLEFDQQFKHGWGGIIYVEVWDGSSWNQVYSVNGGSGSSSSFTTNSQSINISTHAANNSSVKVRFRWVGNYSWWWIIDNVKVFGSAPCSGMPIPGNTVASSNPVCPTANTTLSISGSAATQTGINFQWQSSTNGSTYSNISGATSATYVATQSVSTWYRCNVTCTNSSQSAISTPLQVTMSSFTACYCTPVYSTGCGGGDYISNMQIGSLNNSSGCATGGYADYTGSVSPPNLTLGATYSTSTTVQYSSNYIVVWVDYNHNGVFESSERTALGVVPGSNSPLSSSITIPTTALSGNTVMRVRTVWNSAATDPCSSYTWGEAEDYLVNLVCPAVNITTSPVNTTICQGTNASFNVAGTTTTGFTPLTYQWQVSTNSGSTWSDISNTSVYSGTATSTLNITGATAAMNAYQYRCVVSNSCLTPANSAAATLTVNPTPAVLTTIPGTACNGGPGSVSVTVNGGGTASWYDLPSGGTLLGTGTTLNITSATSTKTYYAFPSIPATPSCVATTRTGVQLVVDPPASVTVNPANATICENTGTLFSVTATNVANYQWQESTNGGSTWSDISNGGSYNTATTSSLTISNASTSLSGNRYRCKLTTSCSVVSYSGSALLTVTLQTIVTTDPSSKAVCNGSGTNFICVATGTGTANYQWQLSTNGGSTYTNLGNTGVYSNTNTNTLNISAVSLGMNNYMYRCITGSTCGTGVASNAATLTINTLPNISVQPTDKIACPGTNTSFSTTASGTAIGYQWQVFTTSWVNLTNTGVYNGANTNTLTLTGVTAGMNGNAYRCVVSGTCNPTVTSSNAVLTVAEDPAVTTQPSSTTTCTNGTGTISITAAGYNNGYQWQLSTNSGSTWNNISNSSLYGGATTTALSITNPTVGMTGYMYRCVVTSGCSLIATSGAATLTVATSPTISVHPANKTLCLGANTTFTTSASSSAPIGYQWQASFNGTTWTNLLNNSTYSGVTTTTLSVSSVNATLNNIMYRCELNTGCIPATTTNAGTLTVNTPPVLDYSPTNATVCQGLNTAFYTNATGSNLNYQWQISTNGGSSYSNLSNGGIYSGANTKVLTLTGVPVANNGYRYRCTISGSCTPSITSAAAILTVNSTAVITSHPTNNLVVCSGDNASYTVGATGTGLTYKWYRYNGSSYVQINNGGIYSGATTNKLNITGITSATTTSTFNYYCSVIGTCNTVNTTTLNLTVHANPTITSNPSNVTVCDSTQYIYFTVGATGSNLTYQWQILVGSTWTNLSNNSTYNNVTTPQLKLLQALLSMNGNQYRCVVTGSCPTATSSAATLNVNGLVRPTITLSGNHDICQGQSTTFTAVTTNAGSSPSYQWLRNGSPVGTGSSYTYASYNDLDYIQCRLISSVSCPSPSLVWSAQTSIRVTQYVTPYIAISSVAGDSSCSGKPTSFQVDTIANGGTNPTYQWQINGTNAGTNSTSFTTAVLQDGDVVSCRLISSLKCLAPAIGTSNAISMKVNPTTLSGISIEVTPDSNICDQVEVLVYAKWTNGGINPTLQWKRNGIDMPGEVDGKLRTSSLNDNDKITVMFYSAATCVYPEESSPITFDVTPLSNPSVDVSVSFNGANSYTFTATPNNGGSNPTFQWFKNFTAINGETGTTFTSDALMNSDVIHVEMMSDGICPDPAKTPSVSRYASTSVSEAKGIFSMLNVYPNPNKGAFTIEGNYNTNGNTDVEIRVVNAVGQNVYLANDKISGGKLEHRININGDVAPGVYIIHISAGGKKDYRRFTITQ